MQSSLFSRLFPVPHMLTMQGGGIEIAERSVKYFRFNTHRGRREIGAFGEISLPAGVIAGGEISNPKALAEALQQVRAHAGFFFAHASLPEEKGYLFDLTIPRESTSALSDSVALAIPDQVPLAPAEVVFDCETIGPESDEFTRSIVVTAYPETVTQSYADALVAAGFFPLSFEMEPQAAARTIGQEGVAGGARLLIDFGADKTVLAVVQNGAVRFAMSSEGTQAFDAKLSERAAASLPEGRTQSVEAEIERLKAEEGLSLGSSVSDILSGSAASLAASVNRMLVYWQSRATRGQRREKIESAVLYGGNANVWGLTEYLSRSTGLSCSLADIRPAFGEDMSVPPIPKNESYRYTTVIGLALRAAEQSV